MSEEKTNTSTSVLQLAGTTIAALSFGFGLVTSVISVNTRLTSIENNITYLSNTVRGIETRTEQVYNYYQQQEGIRQYGQPTNRK